MIPQFYYIKTWFFKTNNELDFVFLFYIFSLILGLSCNSLLILWMIIEINFLTFIYILTTLNLSKVKITRFRYYLIQSILRLLILFMLLSFIKETYRLMSYTLECCFFLKLGMAPGHLWFLILIDKASWNQLFLLRTIQKFIPLNFLNLVYTHWSVIYINLTLIISILNVFLSSSWKLLLGYSSLFFSSWVVATIIVCNELWYALLWFYTLIFSIIYYLGKLENLNILADFFRKKTIEIQLYLLFCLITLRGLPPIVGFFIKLWILRKILLLHVYLRVVLILVSFSIIYLYFKLIFFRLLNSLNNSTNLGFLAIFNLWITSFLLFQFRFWILLSSKFYYTLKSLRY